MDATPSLHLDFAACDRARLAQDPRFDGRFFIGVTSTGIYCRPICPAPTAKQRNVRYFPTAAAAAEAGFRPCLRCRPEAAPGTPAWLGTSATVRRALRLIQEGALDSQSVEELSARLGIGPRHLHRLFVQHVGASPLAVAQTRRLHFAKHLIDDTRLAMTDIALASGFGSLRRFNDAFRQTYGRAPRDLRRERRPEAAGDALRLRLAYRPPYDWTAIREFLALRALPGVERVEDGSYARSVQVGGRTGWIEVRPVPKADALELAVHGLEPAALFGVVSKVRQVFDLAADPKDVREVLRKDVLLQPLLRRRPGLRVPGAWDPFEIAVRAVLGQQVSVAAARTFATRIVAAHGVPLAAPAGGLTHLFPTPAALAGTDLAGIGLTRARAATLTALATAVRDGAVAFDATGEEVRAALRAIPGIGNWTAEYIAMRALSDPDAFPAEDLVLRRVAGGSKPLTAKGLLERSEAWRPWRAYAVLHLWRSSSEEA
ncbi:MAG TPA: AlkA N-terminal domain-containing protein [Gammaproteobacteria bacterium]|jgi:AraC family transcriptional regulator of adaptative response / DNA-3-methyladenine glycosylase II|nr:AlkA N-terminal domain-containing protein [Gammaproteobacteria bacterium]